MGTQKFNSDIDVNGEVKGDSLDINGNADISGNITTATWAGATIAANKIATLNQDTTGQADRLNATDDRNMAPEDVSDLIDFKVFFSTKEGLEDGSTTSGAYHDVLYLNSWNDHSGGDANILAFNKASKLIYHYQADQDATNWGTAKQLAYTDSDVSGNTTGNAGTATKLAATKTIAGVAFDGSANISLNNNAITNGAGYTTYAGPEDGGEGTKGIVEIATEEEAIAGEESVVKAVTPYGVLASFATRKVHELTAPTSAFSMNSQKITGVLNPTAAQDAATKAYTDAKTWNWNDITAGTVPTFNQNTTGFAETLRTARAIYGNNFDGSAAVTGTIATAYIADDAITEDKLANTLLAEIDANTTKNTSPNIYGEYIKITLADFAMGGFTGNTKFGVAFDKTAGSTTYGVRVADSAAELYTFVNIPQGYKATHVEIYGKRTKAVEAFEVQINASTAVSKGTGICNTEFAITNVSSTATNLLMIEVVVNSNAADRVYGGRVKIAVI